VNEVMGSNLPAGPGRATTDHLLPLSLQVRVVVRI
jgi:hypothetical protein